MFDCIILGSQLLYLKAGINYSMCGRIAQKFDPDEFFIEAISG